MPLRGACCVPDSADVKRFHGPENLYRLLYGSCNLRFGMLRG
jgi:hypothetical protein